MINKNHNHGEAALESGIQAYSDSYIILGQKRKLFVCEDISTKLAQELAALLIYYDNFGNEPIELYIHSDGGDMSAFVKIYDVIQMLDSEVHTICLGKCYSAGALLLSAGKVRSAYKHSKIMLHGIQCGFPIPGEDPRNTNDYFKFLEKKNNAILDVLAKNTKKPLAEIKEDCKRDVWMDASEALRYGIIDKII